jgi:hypothetical protein
MFNPSVMLLQGLSPASKTKVISPVPSALTAYVPLERLPVQAREQSVYSIVPLVTIPRPLKLSTPLADTGHAVALPDSAPSILNE